jgi:hypothetical protein
MSSFNREPHDLPAEQVLRQAGIHEKKQEEIYILKTYEAAFCISCAFLG